jgi:ABC-type lipoprotein export system ATPase subunit
MKPSIILPNRTGIGGNETIQSENNIVIVGANGSGKTRLGYWIETALQNQITVHRISAQRVLNIPEYAEIKNLEQAEKGLLFGTDENYGSIDRKIYDRWGSNPQTFLLNDFDKLLSILFAKSTKRDSEHVIATRQQQVYLPVPDAPIDTLCKIWKDIMPHRVIEFVDGKVLVRHQGQAEYHGKEMSDGERVTLYLIGQCLCAPDNSIIIIDEPEIHLHKSLMTRLWDKIEELCPSKLFIFITHDLDFASSRKGARKFWIKSFSGETNWIWDELPVLDELPENLVIEIVGNRKNIIFCEGEQASYDLVLYQAAFPDYYIVPRGGCEKVIESTKAVRENTSLHHLQAFGIIDSDYRTTDEINTLRDAGIFTINVAEIENLFCIEPLLRIVAVNQHLNADATVAAVTTFIINCLKDEFEVQVTNRAEREIQFRLNAYTKAGHTEQGLIDGMTTVLNSIDIAAIYNESRRLYQQAIDENSLERALKLYNRKKLPKRVSPSFGLANNEYVNIVLRLLKSDKKSEIVSAIQNFTPTFV